MLGKSTVPLFDSGQIPTDVFPHLPPELTRQWRADAIREILHIHSKTVEHLHRRLGELLWEVKERKYFRDWGFESFKDYLDTEFSFGLRKGQMLVNLHDTFARRLGLSGERLDQLPWSKAALVCRVATESNIDEILQDIEHLTYSQLKAKYRVAKSTSEQKKILSFGFG